MNAIFLFGKVTKIEDGSLKKANFVHILKIENE